ncbi:MAG: hypothetical protein Q4C58_08605 [Eubacteriales bacterium]|nr:hypothetical protein [Eubacteriales bacterium]
MKQILWKGIGVLAICSILTGCGHEHSWTEATCTEPKTCSECGETEGEPLGHTWVEATCAEPKHCSVCGETEGEALEHTLTEANYQQAPTCEVCGQTVGEPLPADYETWGIAQNAAELDKVYDMEFPCHQNPTKSTLGKVTFTNYQTFSSDDTHEAKDGYEWKSVEITVVFGDDNTWDYGYEISLYSDDYYHWIDNENAEDGYFTINYNGVEYSDCQCYAEGDLNETEGKFDWDATVTTTYKVEILVPVGYDGFIWALYDEQGMPSETEVKDANPEDYIYFRFQ